jgi:AAA+ superfamily predicted ATPase
MLNNRNHFSKKKKYRRVRENLDLSNNNPFTSNNIKINNFHQKDGLHLSNGKNVLKMFKFNDDINTDPNNVNLFLNNKHNTNLCISNKNNLNPFIDCNKMNIIPIKPNKLITCLDNNCLDKDEDKDQDKDEDKDQDKDTTRDKTGTKNDDKKESIKIDREKTDILLKFLLKNSEKEFFEKYNSPLFSGIPRIPLQIDHTQPSIDEDIKNIIKEQVFINTTVENLHDLINLCDKYPLADNIEYNINMKALHNIKPSLIELQTMIGMKTIKENIVDQILYFIQDLHNISPNNSDYMHAVIYGPPGTGKTEVAKIMGKIFSKLGILKNNVFKKVTREDLVAGFLGQTAIKTKDVIKECLGGVLFIDEAYALGNKEKRDSFSKESIDTICEALSDHKKDLMCIIAGYEQELKDCFFSYNPGLESRFTWKFKIDEYTPSELKQIFEKKVKDCGWDLKEPLEDKWFDKNKTHFKYYGRDMEALFSKVKIAHSRRVFCLSKEEKTKINMKDLEKGFDTYKKMGDSDKKMEEQERLKQMYSTIYC